MRMLRTLLPLLALAVLGGLATALPWRLVISPRAGRASSLLSPSVHAPSSVTLIAPSSGSSPLSVPFSSSLLSSSSSSSFGTYETDARLRNLDDEREGAVSVGAVARGALRGAAFLVGSVSPKSSSIFR